MAESWQLIDGHRSSDGLTYTAVYWCSNTGAIKTETTSDGRVRAGDGPRIKRPTQAVEIDQLRQRVADEERLARHHSGMAEAYGIKNDELRAKLALAEKDARRYRWLRDNAASAPGNTPCPYRWTNSDVPETVNGDLLDSEIDAAMRAAIDASGETSA